MKKFINEERNSTVIVEDFNTPISIMDRTTQ
jgi:hypothetical protein